jgi:DTW domain-containing protein
VSESVADPKSGQHKSFGASLEVVPQANRIRVLILQHPQEPDKQIGSAVLCVRCLEHAELKIGLSWPSLAKVAGADAQPSQWGVLYLGAQKDLPSMAPGQIAVLDKKGIPMLPIPKLEGIILIDGTWSQAKAMWWRNAWFLKLRRIVICPAKPSRYGNLRREPRREALSTIESAAQALRGLGEAEDVCNYLEESFSRMLREFQINRGRG